ncbi:hypothetical protein AB9T88_13005, partial [Flavobacterium sp. LBUM151]
MSAIQMGSTSPNGASSHLMNDAIDFYPEYTGTGLLVLLKPSEQKIKEVSKDSRKTYDFVQSEFQKQYQLQW